jgi:hypothetical protein
MKKWGNFMAALLRKPPRYAGIVGSGVISKCQCNKLKIREVVKEGKISTVITNTSKKEAFVDPGTGSIECPECKSLIKIPDLEIHQ